MGSEIDQLKERSMLAANKLLSRNYGYGACNLFPRLFNNSVWLVAKSSLVNHPGIHGIAPWIDWVYIRRREHIEDFGVNLVNFHRVMSSPDIYHPRCVWALFWAMATAEHNFVGQCLRLWSHEERMTGYFVSQLYERISDYSDSWEILCEGDPRESWLDFWYADTATDNQEKNTGADLGIILTGQYFGGDVFYKVMRFQAKKASPTNAVTIDLDQLKNLLATDRLGYYLLYHDADKQGRSRPPSVVPATVFADRLAEAEDRQEEDESDKLGVEGVTVSDAVAFDFAAFITFAAADPKSTEASGVAAGSPREAMRILMGQDRPTRVLVISVGTPVHGEVWANEIREYVHRFERDE